MRQINRYLSNKIKASDIKATNDTIRKIVKDELDRLGHSADLNHIDVSEVTNMIGLFNCHSAALGSAYNDLNPDISDWDVSNVKDIRYMFYKCINFNCDISSWDVRNIKDMTSMFECCENFNQNLSQWEVSNLEDMNCMFKECENFNQDLSQWDVRNVEDMTSMFEGCSSFNQDLSRWDVNNVKNHDRMFMHCPIKKEYEPKFKV